MCKLRSAIATLFLLAAPVALAEVVASAPEGFLSRNVVTVEATPQEAWDAFVEIGEWWNGAHSYSMDASNMSLEARPQGCFCEALPDGGGVRHMQVVAVQPGEMLRMTGGLGPLQANAVRGAMTWQFAAAEGEGSGTTITLTYAVHGWVPDGLEGWSAPVDGVVGEALARLGRYIDSGSPEEAAEDETEG